MKVLILGGDGYLGWPTAMMFAAQGHEVVAVDNYLRRTMALETDSQPLFSTPPLSVRASLFKERSGHDVRVEILDCNDPLAMDRLFATFKPEAVVHYAEQPSAPYSMLSEHAARMTLHNNLGVTFNVIWCVKTHVPDCHIIKLGTMGEYGTPNIDIEEGWINIEHKGRKDKFLFPRAAGSLYHTTKVLDTDLLWFYVRTYGLRVTDLMQGPVYGLSTAEADLDDQLLPNFHYDDIFGTLVNRFLVQAVAGVPLTVYGKGGQTRGYLNLIDTLQCVRLAALNPVPSGELRIMNQFTELFQVNEIAEKVKRVGDHMGLNVEIKSIPNPRKEKEDHYYNAHFSQLLSLGLTPHLMTDEVLGGMLETVLRYKDRIEKRMILPRVAWNK
ncbi:MAG: NAD-dependent epimerase/dehydratase family protein [Hyphomicrobiaceae bacterium]|nr:NAD-dependent epimerase/dehydratase family protein [Hyphomicrobiaceae bacterium]